MVDNNDENKHSRNTDNVAGNNSSPLKVSKKLNRRSNWFINSIYTFEQNCASTTNDVAKNFLS